MLDNAATPCLEGVLHPPLMLLCNCQGSHKLLNAECPHSGSILIGFTSVFHSFTELQREMLQKHKFSSESAVENGNYAAQTLTVPSVATGQL